MTEYTIDFLDLKEGIKYKCTINSKTYELRDGFLFNLETNEFSRLGQLTLKNAKFKEVSPELPEEWKYILLMVNSKFKWIAKDENGEVWLYEAEPQINTEVDGIWWSSEKGETINISYLVEFLNINFDWINFGSPIFIDELLAEFDLE